MRYWKVAGGILQDERGLLLVANRRRDGRVDWTTPGGVIDAGETTIEALGREIVEETGLTVYRFDRLLWTVRVHFPDLEMQLDVEVHRAASWTGEVVVADPDGIVIDVEFLDPDAARVRLRESVRWVAEPLEEWIAASWPEPRAFEYRALGSDEGRLSTERVS